MDLGISPFSYRIGTSFLYKIPPIFKILFMFVFGTAIFAFKESQNLVLSGIFCFLVVFELCVRIGLREQLRTIKPIFFIVVLLFFTTMLNIFIAKQNLLAIFNDYKNFLAPIALSLKFLITMQITSLVFKTTTFLQIKQTLTTIELFFRKVLHLHLKTTFSETFAFMMLFIPRVFDVYSSLIKACIAREPKGKIHLHNYFGIFFEVFALSMHKAYETSKAINSRLK